jgi:hypothetical protein
MSIFRHFVSFSLRAKKIASLSLSLGIALSIFGSMSSFAEQTPPQTPPVQCERDQAGLDGYFYTFSFTNVGAKVKESDLISVMNIVGNRFIMVGAELKTHPNTRCAAGAQIAHVEKSSEPGIYSLTLRVESSCSDYIDDFYKMRVLESEVVVRLVARLSKIPGLDVDPHWKAEGPCPTGNGGVTGSN